VSKPLLTARRAPDGALIADQIKTADNPWRQIKGLIGTKSLAPGAGLWFPGTNSIHMMFMSIPIDVLFLSKPDEQGLRKVLALRNNLPTWRGVVWWVGGSDGCVELDAGVLAGAGIAKGDLISLA
jgi:uncharacterized membrane protein (UPF0127 family)